MPWRRSTVAGGLWLNGQKSSGILCSPTSQRSLTGNRLGRGIEGRTLLLRVAVDEIEDAVRAGPRAVDEIGPGHGTLGRYAGAQVAESAAGASLARLGSRPASIMRAHKRGSIPSTPMTITFLPRLRDTRLPRPSQ